MKQGKPVERPGRKAMGLKLFYAMAARLLKYFFVIKAVMDSVAAFNFRRERGWTIWKVVR